MFVFTSNYEIFGMVLLESMFFGLPVISSMNGGASVLIQNGENGYIMDCFDIQKWMEKIIQLVKDQNQCAEMGKKAHETIEKYFLWERLADQFLNAYNEAKKQYDLFWQEKECSGNGKKN